MAARTLCWLAVLGCWLFGNAIAEVPPTYFSAQSYDFQLTLGQPNSTFSGLATIVLRTNGAADIRSKDLVLSGSGLVPKSAKVEYSNKRVIFVSSTEIKLISDTIIIPGKEFLLQNSTYKITIDYTGWENPNGGIFSTKYSNSVYYGTKLYPIYSNRVFPCLDLPGNQATITLSVTVPKPDKTDVIVVSGLKGDGSTPGTNTVTYKFKSQADIPVSSIFFTAGAYAVKSSTTNVWVPTGLSSVSDTLDKAFQISQVQILAYNASQLFQDFKLSAVVVPGLGSRSDSGLGLAAFSIEQASEVSNMQRKRAQAVETLRAIYRSVYVSLIAPGSWQDIWITESISLYLASKTYPQIQGLEDWKDMTLGVVLTALEDTWSLESSPVEKNITEPSQVVDYLQSSALDKGASILAMLGSVLPTGLDLEIYNQLCVDCCGTELSSLEFLVLFADYASLKNIPGNKTLAQALEPWLTKPGYPAIKVARKEQDIIAGESVFGPSDQGQDIEWIVPVSFRLLTSEMSNGLAENVDDFKWMTPSKNADFKLAEKVSNTTTISLNSRGTGLYRTLYDEKDIELLGEVLSTDENLLQPRSRATLLNDLFAFIKTGEIKYSVVLDMLAYLKNENGLEPWTVAIRGVEELRGLIYFKDSALVEQFNSLIGDYMRYSYLNMPISTAIMEENPVSRILSSKIAKWMCTYDDFTCNTDAVAAYDAYISKQQESSIKNKDIIPVLYCSKLSEVSSDEFKPFLAKYVATSSAEDRRNVLSYLACPQDNATVNWYLSNFMLDKSSFLPDDIVVAFEELAARLEHLDLCFSYLSSNFAVLNRKLTAEHKAKLITILGNFGSSDNHLNILKNFPSTDVALIKKAVDKAVKNVQDRQKFLNDNFHDIQLGLFGFDPNPTTTHNPTPPSPGPDPTPTPKPGPTTDKPSSAPSSAAVFVALLPMAVMALFIIH